MVSEPDVVSSSSFCFSCSWSLLFFFFSSRRRHTRSLCDWSSDVCSSDLKEALGGTLAKFSVSALMFDYVLTGPISGVSAGQYLAGLLNELFAYFHLNLVLPENSTAAFFAVVLTFYFWYENIKGVQEPSHKALRIMQVTPVMVALLIVWCTYTIWVRGAHLPPFPWPSNIRLDQRSLGWLYGSEIVKMIPLIAVFVGIGHS